LPVTPALAVSQQLKDKAAPAYAAASPAKVTPAPVNASPIRQPAKPADAPPRVARAPRQEPAKQASTPSIGRKSEVDALLDDALAQRATGRAAATPSAAVLPQVPAREDVIKSMSVLVLAIRGCAQGASGMAPISMVVRNDGHVESAALSGGPFVGTASGRCMEGVARRARFPRFQQQRLHLQFPFSIQ
jgi:hypothetical protein